MTEIKGHDYTWSQSLAAQTLTFDFCVQRT